MQNERRLQEIGFVSQNLPNAQDVAPDAVPEAAPSEAATSEAAPQEPPNPESAPAKPAETTQPAVQPVKKVASPVDDALPMLLQMAAGDPELTDIVLQFAKNAA